MAGNISFNTTNVEAARKAAEQAAQTAEISGKTANDSETFFKTSEKNFTDFTPELDKAGSDVEVATEAHTSAQDKLQSLSTELRGISSKITEAQRDLQQAGNDENAISEANKKIEEFKAELEKKEAEIKSQEQEVGVKQRDKDIANTALTAARGKLESLELTKNNAEAKAGIDRSTATSDADKAQIAQTNYDNAVKEAKEAEAKAKAEELAKDPSYNKDPNSVDGKLQNIKNQEAENKLAETVLKTGSYDETYDKGKGQEIADKAKNSQYGQTTDGTGYCARGVKDILGLKGDHNANEMQELLDRNPEFKSIDTSEMTEEDLKKLGPGCVVVYTRTDGADSRKIDTDVEGMSGEDARNTFGHVMITDGEGNEISDHIQEINTNRLTDGNLKMHVYVPVGNPDSNTNKNDAITNELASRDGVTKYENSETKPKGEEGFKAEVKKYMDETGEKNEDKAWLHVAGNQPSLVDKAKTAEKIREDVANHNLSNKDKQEFAEAIKNSVGTGRLSDTDKEKLLGKLTNEDTSALTKDEVDEMLYAKGILGADGRPKIDSDMGINAPQDYSKRTDSKTLKVEAYKTSEIRSATNEANRNNTAISNAGKREMDDLRKAGRITEGITVDKHAANVENIPQSVIDVMTTKVKETSGTTETTASGLYALDLKSGTYSKKVTESIPTSGFTSYQTSYTKQMDKFDNKINLSELKQEIEDLRNQKSLPSWKQTRLNACLDLAQLMTDNNKTTFDNNEFRRLLAEASKNGTTVNFLDALK